MLLLCTVILSNYVKYTATVIVRNWKNVDCSSSSSLWSLLSSSLLLLLHLLLLLLFLFLLLLLLLSSSVQMAYREPGVSNLSISFTMKIHVYKIYSYRKIENMPIVHHHLRCGHRCHRPSSSSFFSISSFSSSSFSSSSFSFYFFFLLQFKCDVNLITLAKLSSEKTFITINVSTPIQVSSSVQYDKQKGMQLNGMYMTYYRK